MAQPQNITHLTINIIDPSQGAFHVSEHIRERIKSGMGKNPRKDSIFLTPVTVGIDRPEKTQPFQSSARHKMRPFRTHEIPFETDDQVVLDQVIDALKNKSIPQYFNMNDWLACGSKSMFHESKQQTTIRTALIAAARTRLAGLQLDEMLGVTQPVMTTQDKAAENAAEIVISSPYAAMPAELAPQAIAAFSTFS